MHRPNDLLTAGEAAELRGVNVKSIYRAIEENRLVAERRGKTLLIRYKELMAWPAKAGRPKKDTGRKGGSVGLAAAA